MNFGGHDIRENISRESSVFQNSNRSSGGSLRLSLSPFCIAMQSPAPSKVGTPSSSSRATRDTMLKVTFSVKHEVKDASCSMFVTGSLPSLGSWEHKRARKMTSGEDGVWNLAIYIPERAEFLYQYIVMRDDSEEPTVVWEGCIERKCKLADASETPSKAVRLRDDATGESSGHSIMSTTPLRKDPFAPSAKDGVDERLAIKDAEIEQLVQERERCSNELQRIKDILGFSDTPDEYKKRSSYLPDQGPLYETARQLQTAIKSKIVDKRKSIARMSMGLPISEDGSAPGDAATLAAEREQHEMTQALLAERNEYIASLEAEFKAEKQELQAFYQKSLGELDGSHQDAAAKRMREEEAKTMMQSNLRVTAGELHSVRSEFEAIRGLGLDMQASISASFEELSTEICDKVYGFCSTNEEELSIAQDKYRKEVTERKRLHNVVQELKGNIRVFARSRPLSSKDKAAGKAAAVTFTSETEMLLNNAGKLQNFQYDMTFGPESTQAEVFAETQPLVISVLDGYNVCIFAYGQTGSGKTHTMQGYGDEHGVNPRALNELFNLAKERKGAFDYDISVSLLEIYNETIRDLVEPHDESGQDKKLDVKMASEGGTFVPNLSNVAVTCMDDVLSVLATGESNRSVGKTNMNEHSSRSHMILTVSAKSRNCVTGAKSFGKLHLIDLAGSERIGKSGAQGDRLKEAQNINKSLSALGDCVQSLVSKSKHVPFRNSKLTHLLQDSLGGESKALMFVCVSPADSDVSETNCSLNFASRVRNVELGQAKRKGGNDALAELKLKDKERECDALRDALRKAEASAEKKESRAKSLAKAKEEAESARLDMSREMEGREGERENELMAEIAQLRQQLEESDSRASAQQEAPPTSLFGRKRSAMDTPSARASAPKTPRRGAASAAAGQDGGGKTPRGASAKKATAAAVSKTPSRKTPSRGGATPRKGVLRPSSSSNADRGNGDLDRSVNKSLNRSDAGLTLDEKLERLRAKKREAAELASEMGGGGGGSKRPATAPVSRPVATRLGSGASRIASGAQRAPVGGAAAGGAAKRPKTGGWR